MLPLIHSSNIVLPYGCIIVALIIGKLTDSTKVAKILFIEINNHHRMDSSVSSLGEKCLILGQPRHFLR